MADCYILHACTCIYMYKYSVYTLLLGHLYDNGSCMYSVHLTGSGICKGACTSVHGDISKDGCQCGGGGHA